MGSLRYLVNTRHNIAYVVRIASRFLKALAKEHWSVVKRIVRYLVVHLTLGASFRKGRSLVSVFWDILIVTARVI